MHTETQPLLLDLYLPRYDVTEVHAVVVDADLNATWQAIRHGDLSRSLVIRALLELRGLPIRLRQVLTGRPPGQARPPLTLDDMARAGFQVLQEQPGTEIVLGFVGRAWKVTDTTNRTPTIGPGEFAAFATPGYTKVAFNIRLEPYGRGRTLVTTETRTASTDPATKRRFGLYWALIGPFSALIRRLMLRLVKADAEKRSEGSQREKRAPNLRRIEGEIVINRPVEEVFDFVADARNEPQYNPRMRRAEQTSTGPIGRGTQFRCELGRAVEISSEITAYERPQRLGWSTRSASRRIKAMPAMEIRGTLTFDAVPDGTRMRWSWDLEVPGVLKLPAPLIVRVGQHQEATIWAGLKRLLERQGAPIAHA